MDSSTVLSHLAFRFTTQPENLATEALTFILNRSQSARAALTTIVRKFHYPCSEQHRFETQNSNDDGSRPDIVGKTNDGTAEIVIEVKFWAGLTDAQPAGYLEKLHSNGAILLFVAPGQRFETLWSELARRCERAGLQLGPVSNPGKEMRCITIGNNVLALTSWPAVLGAMRGQAEVDSDGKTIADIAQLSGLSEQMDSDAFLPLTSEELTGATGKRIIQLSQIVKDIRDRLILENLVTVTNQSSASGIGYNGHYMTFSGFCSFLTFSAWLWAKTGKTPLWLQVTGNDWKLSSFITDALTEAGFDWEPDNNYASIPVYLPTGVEKNNIIDAAIEQIKHVADVLSGTK